MLLAFGSSKCSKVPELHLPSSRGSVLPIPSLARLPSITRRPVVVSLVVGVAFSAAALSSSPLPAPPVPRRESVDGPAGVSPGEGGGIGSSRRASPGGGASSLRSTNRARIRGLSIVLGSPPPLPAPLVELGGSCGPPCRSSRWSGCRRDGSAPGGPVCPDSTRRGRVSSSLASSEN